MTTHHRRHLSRILTVNLFVVGLVLVIGSTSALGAPLSSASVSSEEPKSSGDVIITTNEPEKLERALERKNLEVTEEVSTTSDRTYIAVDASQSDRRIQEIAQEQDGIIIGNLKPNFRYKLTATPNDTYYPAQWNLPKIKAPTAWDRSANAPTATVAVIDSGVLSNQSWNTYGPFTQPDFPSSKIWKNQGELGTTATEGSAPNCSSQSLTLDKSCNNIDDDANGFIDDYRGWDFMGGYYDVAGTCPNYLDGLRGNPAQPQYISEDNDPQPYSCDDSSDIDQLNKDHYSNGCGYGLGACVLSHGTSVASIIAASSNDAADVAGVDWNADIMNLRVFDGYGFAETVDIAAALDYAIDNNADVINLSLTLADSNGCTATDSIIESLLSRAQSRGIVVVGASGNEGDSNVCYPARSKYAIAVGASTISDKRAGFSSYGSGLDLMAPGNAVPAANAPSALNLSTYSSAVNGTSFAAPHVSGAAAMMKSLRPSASAVTIRDQLRYSADKLSSMNYRETSSSHGYGRLNVARAIQFNSKAWKNEIVKTQTLRRGESLRSTIGDRLLLRTDGNLVLYNPSGRVKWTSNTANKKGSRVIFQRDGNVVLYSSYNKPLWSTNTHRTKASRFILQRDGNLVVYSSTGKALWNTRTNR